MGRAFLDQYSLLHAAVGVVLYFWGIGFTATLLLHTLFEFAENTLTGMALINSFKLCTTCQPLWPGGKDFADSGLNMLGDTVAVAAGWLAAAALDAYLGPL